MTYAQWERMTEWPLAGAALGFLGIYGWTVLAQPERTSATLAEHAVQAIWVLFIIDYLARLTLAERRGRWFVYHLHELAIVVLPILRPLRLLRLLTVVSFLQRSVGGALRGRVVTYAITGTALLIAVAALAMLDAERAAPEATITTFPDALWWAVVTVTTVGYGDLSPVTPAGRLIAVGLMVAGIALLGVVTATLASWLVQKVAEQDEMNQAATRQQVAELSRQVQALRAELGAAGPSVAGVPARPHTDSWSAVNNS
ncbi:ion channel [Rhodococcus opacus]|uniref:ion channel n=1 Tax=Rhodococcus opacus TaxID=37919 RepID=UPI0034D23D59